MHILYGYVAGVERGITRVRRRDGGTINVLTKQQYNYGDNLVMEYDPLCNLVVNTHTAAEWEALARGDDMSEPPGIEEDDDAFYDETHFED
jgi:hypothetical protein